jgi:hypothetical protein
MELTSSREKDLRSYEHTIFPRSEAPKKNPLLAREVAGMERGLIAQPVHCGKPPLIKY